jgi:hypothetical protein
VSLQLPEPLKLIGKYGSPFWDCLWETHPCRHGFPSAEKLRDACPEEDGEAREMTETLSNQKGGAAKTAAAVNLGVG